MVKFFVFTFTYIFSVSIIFSQLLPYNLRQEDTNETIVEYDYATELEKSTYNPKFGLLLGYGLNFHRTNFKELPNYPTYSEIFESGFGHGISFGGLFQFRINKDWNIGSQLLISNLNGLLKHTNMEPITIGGELQTANIDHNIDISINTIVLNPYVAYNINKISDNFQVTAGLNLGIISKANFTQYEELVSPSTIGTFENGYTIRNNVTADLPDKNILFGGNIGAQYEFPLNKSKNWQIVPELKYNFWLTSPVKSLNWLTSQIVFGVSIRYNQPPLRPVPIDPILPPLPPMRLPNIDSKFIVDINHILQKVNVDGTYSDADEIVVEEYTQSNLKPILNYIFFDAMSDVIPSRYKHIDTNKMFSDEYRNFSNMNSVETYYYLLDIIAFRMKKNPTATIELVGTNSGNGLERNNLELSQRRANNVKKYLMDTWGIEDFRIKTTARNLPKDPTRPTEGSGDEENRRVEIYSSNNLITEAILSSDTISVLKTSHIKFVPTITSSFGVNNAELIVKRGNILYDSICLPPGIEMEITDEIINSNTDFPFTYQLTAYDKIGQSVSSELKQVNINRVTVESKKNNNTTDTNYENYSLILFEFNSTDLGAKNNKVIDYIKTRIKDDSKIIVSGYTDIIGLPEANKRIATERASASAKRLDIKNVELRGIGTDELLYDNKYPEGRFYCRTVTIYIATPVSND